MNKRVKINSATRAELDMLYQIGPERSQSIIDYRQQYGYFKGQADLAQVRGVGKRLAVLLAPLIDWEIPQKPEPPKARRSYQALLAGGIIILLEVIAFIIVSETRRRLLLFKYSYHWSLDLLIYLAYVIMAFVGLIGITFAGECLTTSRKRARKWADYEFLIITIVALLVLGVLLTLAVSFSHYGYGGIKGFFSDPPVQGIIGALVLLLLIFGPKILILHKPELASNQWAARVYDWAWTAGIFFTFWNLWLNLRVLPQEILLTQVAVGAICAYQGYQVIVRRRSLFQVSIDFLDPSRTQSTAEDLIQRLNQAMPSEEEQRLLAHALARKYPASMRSKLVGTLMIGFFGWVIGQTLGSIIELFVQHWVRQLINFPPD